MLCGHSQVRCVVFIESWLTPTYTTYLGDVVKASDFLSGKLTGE